MPDGTFIHYEWTYGSCSGCDEWEARSLSDNEIEKEMRSAMAILENIEEAKKYFKLEGKYENAEWRSANSVNNGSIPGMLHYLSGGIGKNFKNAGKALLKWERKQQKGAKNEQSH